MTLGLIPIDLLLQNLCVKIYEYKKVSSCIKILSIETYESIINQTCYCVIYNYMSKSNLAMIGI